MEFRALVDDLLDGYFRHNPVLATEKGKHDHDERWDDLSDAGRREWLAWIAKAPGAPRDLAIGGTKVAPHGKLSIYRRR